MYILCSKFSKEIFQFHNHQYLQLSSSAAIFTKISILQKLNLFFCKAYVFFDRRYNAVSRYVPIELETGTQHIVKPVQPDFVVYVKRLTERTSLANIDRGVYVRIHIQSTLLAMELLARAILFAQ